jgi:peptidylprolyl isomerase domain and WD repeat-containing protein 1
VSRSSHFRTGFVITTSVDGHLKLWKKQEVGIEFVKHYRTSLKAIVGMAASDEGTMVATISEGGEGRVFDVVNFGMSSLSLNLYSGTSWGQTSIGNEA